MRTSRGFRAVVVAAFALAAPLLGARCGGGAGGGGGGGGGGGDGLARIEGTVFLAGQDLGCVGEIEPNGAVDRAQALPPLQPRSRLVVAGLGATTEDAYGRVDTVDAFRIVCGLDQDASLVLLARTGGIAQGDFDVAAFDTATGDPLASASGPGEGHAIAFALEAGAPVDVVVTCADGWGAYTLAIETDDPTGLASLSAGGDGLSPDALGYALSEPAVEPARIVVRPVPGTDVAALAATVGARVERRTSGGSAVLSFPPRFRTAGAREALARAARLAASGRVLWAEPDARVEALDLPTDPLLAAQWQWEGIGAGSAWAAGLGSPDVVIGLVDTGIAAHPDLAGQTVPGYDFVTNAGAAADGDGRDPDPTDPGAQDEIDGTSSWHGTHVAGLACAKADGEGVVGLAPGCRAMALRCIGRGGGSATDLADAIRYAAGLSATEHGGPLPAPLRVVNLSVGTSVASNELRAACEAASEAGCLLVAAAGNTGGPVLFPAAYPEVIAVGATDSRFVRAEYSNAGPELDLLAPGGDARDRDADGFRDGVLSCSRDETRVPARWSFAPMVGTSMATPQVSATAALLLSVDPTLSAAALRDLLLGTAKDRGVPGPDAHAGHGVLHAGDAVKAALDGVGPPRGGPPAIELSTESLRFRPPEATATVYATNAGGGTLTLGEPVVSTDDGLPWLHVSLTHSPTLGPPDVPQVHVTVDATVRALLPPGSYAGTVGVTDGGAVRATIRVVMEVGLDLLTDEPLQVVAQEEGSGTVRASGFAYPWEAYRYVLLDLPPGSYVVKAGTDLDEDFFFCEGPDLCGRHGGFDTPVPVAVEAGDRVVGVDVFLE